MAFEKSKREPPEIESINPEQKTTVELYEPQPAPLAWSIFVEAGIPAIYGLVSASFRKNKKESVLSAGLKGTEKCTKALGKFNGILADAILSENSNRFKNKIEETIDEQERKQLSEQYEIFKQNWAKKTARVKEAAELRERIASTLRELFEDSKK